MRKIISRYPNKCPICKFMWLPGDQIKKDQERNCWVHETCPDHQDNPIYTEVSSSISKKDFEKLKEICSCEDIDIPYLIRDLIARYIDGYYVKTLIPSGIDANGLTYELNADHTSL